MARGADRGADWPAGPVAAGPDGSVARVGIFNSAPLEFMGGGEVMELAIAKALTTEGFEVHMISDSLSRIPRRVTGSDLTQRLTAPYTQEPFDQPPFLHSGRAGRHALPSAQQLQAYDLNMIFLYRVPDRRYLDRLRSTSVPTVFLMHGVPIEPRMAPHPLVIAHQVQTRWALRRMARRVAGRPVFFQAVNSQMREFLIDCGVPAARIFLIPNAVEFDHYRTGGGSTRFQIVFAARLDDFQKGLPLLLRMIRTAPRRGLGEATFKIVGTGREFAALSRRLGGTPNVELTGYLSESEKCALLASSDLFLSTSYVEVFSVSVLEGLASGLPVVSTPTAGPTSIVTADPHFGKVGGFSARSLLGLIHVYYRSWKDDRVTYDASRAARSRRAKALFDLPVQLPKYAQMLRTVMESLEH